MKYTDIQEKFNELWASKITNIDFNIINNSIEIAIEILDSGERSEHIIEFQEVCSYFFINNIGDKRKEFVQPENGDFLELTSINVIDNNSEIKTESQEDVRQGWYKL